MTDSVVKISYVGKLGLEGEHDGVKEDANDGSQRHRTMKIECDSVDRVREHQERLVGRCFAQKLKYYAALSLSQFCARSGF